MLLLRQDFTDSPCIDSVIGGNVMLMLPAPMTEPNVNSFILDNAIPDALFRHNKRPHLAPGIRTAARDQTAELKVRGR